MIYLEKEFFCEGCGKDLLSDEDPIHSVCDIPLCNKCKEYDEQESGGTFEESEETFSDERFSDIEHSKNVADWYHGMMGRDPETYEQVSE